MNFNQYGGPDQARLAMLAQMRQKPYEQRPEVFATGASQPSAAAPAAAAPAAPAAPAPYQAKGPALGLEGFNADKLANANHITPKYVFARHAQGLGVADQDELLNRLRNDQSGFFKNARWSGSKNDRIFVDGDLDPRFEGIREFDVVRAMGEGGKGWQWAGEGGPSQQLKTPQPRSNFASQLPNLGARSDVLDRINAEIAALSGNAPVPTEQEAILQLLRSGRA